MDGTTTTIFTEIIMHEVQARMVEARMVKVGTTKGRMPGRLPHTIIIMRRIRNSKIFQNIFTQRSLNNSNSKIIFHLRIRKQNLSINNNNKWRLIFSRVLMVINFPNFPIINTQQTTTSTTIMRMICLVILTPFLLKILPMETTDNQENWFVQSIHRVVVI